MVGKEVSDLFLSRGGVGGVGFSVEFLDSIVFCFLKKEVLQT